MGRSKKKELTKPETSAAPVEETFGAEENNNEDQAAMAESPAAEDTAERPAEEIGSETTGDPAADAATEEADVQVSEIASGECVAERSAEDAPAEEIQEAPAIEESAEETVSEEPKKKISERIPASVRETVGDVLDTCESVIVAMFTVLLIFTYLFSVAVVEGDSMLPTLREGDRLMLVNFDDPDVGDIVVLNSEYSYTFDSNGELTEEKGLGKKIVKRLIATENQTVNIDFAAGIVYVDGVALEENYTSTLTTRDEGAFRYPITVPEGYVFVLGDNRSVSKDSRHPDVGLIPEDDIVGTVWLRVYPFTDFAAVQ